MAIALAITDDEGLEGDRPIELTLQNRSVGLNIGDDTGDTATQNTHTYTITDDDAAAVTIRTLLKSKARGSSLP